MEAPGGVGEGRGLQGERRKRGWRWRSRSGGPLSRPRLGDEGGYDLIAVDLTLSGPRGALEMQVGGGPAGDHTGGRVDLGSGLRGPGQQGALTEAGSPGCDPRGRK